MNAIVIGLLVWSGLSLVLGLGLGRLLREEA